MADTGARTSAVVAGNNPWLVAAGISLRPLAGDGHFSEDWLFGSGKVAYELPLKTRALGSTRIPIMANFADLAAKVGDKTKTDSVEAAIQSLTSSDAGMNVGVYPYWVVRDEMDIRTTIFSGAAAKVNSYAVDTVETNRETLFVGRFTGGIEFSLGAIEADSKPLTVTFAGVYSRFGANSYQKIFGEKRSSLWSGELTTILPFKAGMGALFEAVAVQTKKPSFRLGMLFTVGSGNSQPIPPTPQTPNSQCAETCVVVFAPAAALGQAVALTVTPATANGAANCKSLANTTDSCSLSVPGGTALTVSVPAGFTLGGDAACAANECKWAALMENGKRVTIAKAPNL